MIEPIHCSGQANLTTPTRARSYANTNGPAIGDGLKPLEEAFRADPVAFEVFVAGVTAAAVRSMKGPDALPEPDMTLDRVISVYRKVSLIRRRVVENNVLAMLRIVEVATGQRDPAKAPLSEINANLVACFQERYMALKTAGIHEGPTQRDAQDRVLRTSRHYIRQARSLFAARGLDLLSRYAAEGIRIPDCVGGFLKAKVRGSRHRKVYVTASETAIARAVKDIEKMRLTDLPVFFGFWLAIGGGLRRNEILQCRWEHLVEVNGALWVKGAPDLIGKSGEPVEVQLQRRAADALRPFLRSERLDRSSHLVDTQYHRRLNRFLREVGFKTRLGLHELRAWLGSKVYEVNPRAAKELLRHSSILVTEQAYCRYVNRATMPEVL